MTFRCSSFVNAAGPSDPEQPRGASDMRHLCPRDMGPDLQIEGRAESRQTMRLPNAFWSNRGRAQSSMARTTPTTASSSSMPTASSGATSAWNPKCGRESDKEAFIMTSKVWYAGNRSSSPSTSYVAMMLEAFEAAGFDKMIKPHDTVAIKTHCGEWNNTAYLRPVYARALADRIKELVGLSFCHGHTMPLPWSPASRATELGYTDDRRAKRLHVGCFGLPLYRCRRVERDG